MYKSRKHGNRESLAIQSHMNSKQYRGNNEKDPVRQSGAETRPKSAPYVGHRYWTTGAPDQYAITPSAQIIMHNPYSSHSTPVINTLSYSLHINTTVLSCTHPGSLWAALRWTTGQTQRNWNLHFMKSKRFSVNLNQHQICPIIFPVSGIFYKTFFKTYRSKRTRSTDSKEWIPLMLSQCQ